MPVSRLRVRDTKSVAGQGNQNRARQFIAVVNILSAKRVKLLVLAFTALGVLAVSLISRERPASANVDNTLEQIAAYRTWTKVTQEPIKGAPISIDASPENFGGG